MKVSPKQNNILNIFGFAKHMFGKYSNISTIFGFVKDLKFKFKDTILMPKLGNVFQKVTRQNCHVED